MDVVAKTLLELSTGTAGNSSSGGADIESAELKARVVATITNIQTKYQTFMKYADTFVNALSGFTTKTANMYGKNAAFDKVYDAVKYVENIGGKAAEMVQGLVSLMCLVNHVFRR